MTGHAKPSATSQQPVLHLLCAGAAQGLVMALQPAFEAATGVVLQSRFGAVGAMKEALLAGQPCDLMVLTDTMVSAMAADGQLLGATRAPLGRVFTGVAVRRGAAVPAVATPDALRQALLAADEIYFPDPERATAGIHFAKVLRELGVFEALQLRFKTFPNGATAMRELALTSAKNPMGCTQVSEIMYTQGVTLVGALPKQFELGTLYTAAVAAGSAQQGVAQRLMALLTSTDNATLRQNGGFEA